MSCVGYDIAYQNLSMFAVHSHITEKNSAEDLSLPQGGVSFFSSSEFGVVCLLS